MSTVIQVTNLSKIYRLGEIGTGTISRDLERWYKMRIRGLEDPFLKIGETNERNKKGVSDVVYALRDINFEVQQGEALGIIGKNGAGKSTLLKILSRVTSPTKGNIRIKGRVASLLEVGTGFHPELTGRENIYLNGAILGMRKKEITRKLEEIIDFSGVERYIDTPVKRYSSGMYVRLAFAVAAHLESEIMVVDEVLAVGDAEFQKRCLGKMDEVSKGEGRTVLFVSHNMTAIKGLCVNCILLDNGLVDKNGETEVIINEYLKNSTNSNLNNQIRTRTDRSGDGKLKFINFEILTDDNIIRSGDKTTFRIHFEVNQTVLPLKNVAISFSINTLDGNHALVFFTEEQNQNIRIIKNDGFIDCLINDFPLCSGSFTVNLYATVNNLLSDYLINAYLFMVDDSYYFKEGRSKHPSHPIYLAKHHWIFNE